MIFVHLYFAFNLLILVQDALMFNFLISAPEPPFEALDVPETPLSISSPAQPTPATAEKRKENKPQELSKKQVFKSFCNFYNLFYLIFLLLPMLKVQLCTGKLLGKPNVMLGGEGGNHILTSPFPPPLPFDSNRFSLLRCKGRRKHIHHSDHTKENCLHFLE